MTTRPLFSIVTVTKNNLRGLNETFDSVKAQSCKDYEWIVIDGLSEDGSKEFLAALPVHSISEPDDGIYDAMNKGIERAQGDYIIFLNAGDKLADPDILSTLSKAIRAETPDFIYGDALETGGFYKKARPHAKIDWGMVTHHQAMLYKRKVIGDLRYDKTLRIAADYGFTAAFLAKTKNIHYIPCAVCIFEEGGISQQQRRLGRREQYGLRAAHGVCNPVKNIIVYTGQSASAFLRERMPKTYRFLRSGMNSGNS